MQKITPCLWFNGNAEEAANFYVSVFQNSKIGTIARHDEASSNVSGMPKGSAILVAFELDGQKFQGLNGGPQFTFSEAVSFSIECKDQEEVDHFWNALSAHPEAEQCGWVKDKFGLSWQIVPTILSELLSDPNPVKASRVMQAMLQMKKLDIAALKAAYDG